MVVRRSVGACTDQPAEKENTNFTERVRATAGKVEELGGLVWAYVGPDPAPLPSICMGANPSGMRPAAARPAAQPAGPPSDSANSPSGSV